MAEVKKIQRKAKKKMYIQVIVPVPQLPVLTYAISDALLTKANLGARALVPFGSRNKWLTSIVLGQTDKVAEHLKVKHVVDIIDEAPVIQPWQIAFWRWISDYYMSYPGEIMQASLPAALKPESESYIVADIAEVPDEASETEARLLKILLRDKRLRLGDLPEMLQRKDAMPIVRRLLDQGWVAMEETLKHTVSAPQKKFVRFCLGDSDNVIDQTFSSLKNAPVQSRMLMAYFTLSGGSADLIPAEAVIKKAEANASHLKTLVNKGIFEEVMRHEYEVAAAENSPSPILSPDQLRALETVETSVQEGKPCLLWGVTGSGKTEVYIHAIKGILEQGKNALFLMPEISLTTQMIQRLRKHFGDGVLIYHSRLTQRERLKVWMSMLNNRGPYVVVGARSAMFLPLAPLGIIVIDEEHDPSYKQQSPAPRYHARDSAIKMAQLLDCGVVLGSATPSLESFHNAKEGKYNLATLTQRYGEAAMPNIEIVDLKRCRQTGTLKGNFSEELLQLMESVKASERQTILFQNRRGYAPSVQCTACGHIPECRNCDISLTYHKIEHKLKCHYCGYQQHPPQKCPECGSTHIKQVGFGTEKIEDEIPLYLKGLNIARMDLDSTRGKYSFQKLIDRLESSEIDVLVGTQMVTKGLDFSGVALVGILQADQLLYMPDFRAHERAYQLMAQVAGRAGRRKDPGLVMIQTYQPEHFIIKKVVENDYEGMVRWQLADRREFNYPPYTRLIQITLKHNKKDRVIAATNFMAEEMKKHLGNRVLGPHEPSVARIKNLYYRQILLKLEKGVSLPKVKNYLWKLDSAIKTHKPFSGVQVVFDVDPY